MRREEAMVTTVSSVNVQKPYSRVFLRARVRVYSSRGFVKFWKGLNGKFKKGASSVGKKMFL
jgi:hypothetical protein